MTMHNGPLERFWKKRISATLSIISLELTEELSGIVSSSLIIFFRIEVSTRLGKG